MSKFEVGKTVRIKDSISIGKKYGGLILLESMANCRGVVAKIVDISPNGFYRLELPVDKQEFYWSDKMLEPVGCDICIHIDKYGHEEPCCNCGKDYSQFTPQNQERLSVNQPSLEALEKYIVATTRAIFEADEEHDQLEVFELQFIENLLKACCKHKVIRLTRKEDDDNGDC